MSPEEATAVSEMMEKAVLQFYGIPGGGSDFTVIRSRIARRPSRTMFWKTFKGDRLPLRSPR